jgi:hypothetical protein
MARTQTRYLESAIVNLWNSKILSSQEEKWRESVERAVKLLKCNGISGKAILTGDSHTPITNKWLDYKRKFKTQSRIAKTSQSKVDILIGNSRISLKIGKYSGIMSSMKEEALAAFYCTSGNSLELEEILKSMRRDIYTKEGTHTQALKNGCLEAILRKNHNKEQTKKINNILNNNLKLKRKLIFEGLTGLEKFGSENSATHILHLDKEDSFSRINTEYIENLDVIVEQKFKSESEKIKGERTGRYHLKHVFMIALP